MDEVDGRWYGMESQVGDARHAHVMTTHLESTTHAYKSSLSSKN
jgi:hypothetical protein